MTNPNHRELGLQKWKDQRVRVLKRDNYTCAYCGLDANQVDHIIPRSAGGSHDLDNLVACCKPCNTRKGSKNEAVFLGAQSTPPVFQGNLSPRAASVIPENPFVTETKPIIN
jgi:hypothetical protein